MRGLLPHRLITKLALVATLLVATAPLVVASVDAQPAPSHAALGVLVPRGDVRLLLPLVDHPALADHAGIELSLRAVAAPPAGHARRRRVQPDQPLCGNIETDAPAALFTQDDPSQVTYDVQSAIAAGLTGFAVDWYGTGSATQTPTSNGEDQRLDLLVQAVDQAQAEGHNFHLWLSYEASSTGLTQTAIAGDLSYLTSQYGNDPAFDRSNGGKPTFIWVGSYKYSLPVVAAISNQFRSAWYFVGGYQWNQWNDTVAPYFDADSPYWSSQDPWTNSPSFQQLDGLAATLHAEGKKYFAPLAPGFDRQLDGSATCVPRDDGATLQALFDGNASADPEGWLLISWNEITEGTYVTPELQRYGGSTAARTASSTTWSPGRPSVPGPVRAADRPATRTCRVPPWPSPPRRDREGALGTGWSTRPARSAPSEALRSWGR